MSEPEIRPRYEARPGVRPNFKQTARPRRRRRPRPATVGHTLWMITALLALLALVLAGLAYFGLTRDVRAGGMLASELVLEFVLVSIVVIVFGSLAAILLQHFRGLRKLHRAVRMLANRDADWTPPREAVDGTGAVSALFRGLSRMQDSWRGRSSLSTTRLTAILGALSEGVVVIGRDGRVGLVNAGARALFGARRLRVGSSAFDYLDSNGLNTGMRSAAEMGRPVKTEIRTTDGGAVEARIADLGEDLGVLLCFSNVPEPAEAGVEEDLATGDGPPEALPADDETPLAELPALAIKTETTGLSVRDDRIIAVAAVRTFGTRIYADAALEELINPGIMIPPRAVSKHGITDDMVRDARTFMQVYESLQPLAHATVLVGHNLAFDLAMLKREAGLAGLRWDEPQSLCTMMLAAALDPQRKDLSLDAVARDFGVETRDGDKRSEARLVAELFIRMIPRLAEQGIETFGEAVELAGRLKHLLEKQKAAGLR